MRKILKVLPVTILSVLLSATVFAGETLNNDTIIKMVRAGLDEEVIIQKIKSTHANYDTSAEKLINLKENGVSNKIISAMMSSKAEERDQEKNEKDNAIEVLEKHVQEIESINYEVISIKPCIEYEEPGIGPDMQEEIQDRDKNCHTEKINFKGLEITGKKEGKNEDFLGIGLFRTTHPSRIFISGKILKKGYCKDCIESRFREFKKSSILLNSPDKDTLNDTVDALKILLY